MLATVTLIFCYVLVFVMMPLMIWQLIRGSPPSSRSMFRKYEMAQPCLGFVGNVFLLALCFIALKRLVAHFALIDPAPSARMDALLHYPFMALFALYVAFWIGAVLKTRRPAT